MPRRESCRYVMWNQGDERSVAHLVCGCQYKTADGSVRQRDARPMHGSRDVETIDARWARLQCP